MGRFLTGFLLPLLLLTAASLTWSLISLVNLIAFLFTQILTPESGIRPRKQAFLSRCLFVFSLLVLLSHAAFHFILVTDGDQWTVEDAKWVNLMGLIRVHSKAPSAIAYLVIHVAVALISMSDIYGSRVDLEGWAYSLSNLTSQFDHLGLKLREVYWLLLPIIQLGVGISHPSCISLPYFIGSCIGLVDWSLNSNSLGLFRWWSYFLPYAASNIVLLYMFQLPIQLPGAIKWLAEFIGLYKISLLSDWSERCSGLFLLLFFNMLACLRCELAEMGSMMSTNESNLTEPLLPSSQIRQSRSWLGHSNLLSRGAVFRIFTINFFTYGFPVRLRLMIWIYGRLLACGIILYQVSISLHSSTSVLWLLWAIL